MCYVDEGDSFLVYKGFTIPHLLVAKQATVTISRSTLHVFGLEEFQSLLLAAR